MSLCGINPRHRQFQVLFITKTCLENNNVTTKMFIRLFHVDCAVTVWFTRGVVFTPSNYMQLKRAIKLVNRTVYVCLCVGGKTMQNRWWQCLVLTALSCYADRQIVLRSVYLVFDDRDFWEPLIGLWKNLEEWLVKKLDDRFLHILFLNDVIGWYQCNICLYYSRKHSAIRSI